MQETYTQCRLEKKNHYQICFIPTIFAKIGEIIKIKVGDAWDNGWKVTKIGQTINKDFMIIQERLYKRNRKVSDI